MSNANDSLTLRDYESDETESEDTSHSHRCKLVTQKETNKDECYILHLSTTPDASCNIAFGTSNNHCEVYRLGENQLAKLETLDRFEHSIVGVQFSPDNNNLVYVGTNRGNIQIWDLRSPQVRAVQFSEASSEQPDDVKTLTCFDVSSNNRLLAAGTELYKGEAFILFWDIRNTSILGGYWESHTDDITQVKFEHNNVNKLMSGSVDGLINVYDVKHTNEDDALIDTFNSESSVEQLLWYSNERRDFIGCITHTVDIQLWSPDGVEPYAHFRRSDITRTMKRKSESHCYIAGAHKLLGDEMLILAGSNWNNGECLQCIFTKNKQLEHFSTLKGNNQVVRCSLFNQYYNTLFTGGEQGTLQIWNVNVNS